MALSRAKTFVRPMKTPALQANWARLWMKGNLCKHSVICRKVLPKLALRT